MQQAKITSYAGDISPAEAYGMLETKADAMLVDVRTRPEWEFVGTPDLSPLGKEVVFSEWQSYPSAARGADFVAEVAAAATDKNRCILFICRSGARSRSAAMALTSAGFAHCYNVSDGFEGPLDDKRRRGSSGGWKASGLPWKQA